MNNAANSSNSGSKPNSKNSNSNVQAAGKVPPKDGNGQQQMMMMFGNSGFNNAAAASSSNLGVNSGNSSSMMIRKDQSKFSSGLQQKVMQQQQQEESKQVKMMNSAGEVGQNQPHHGVGQQHQFRLPRIQQHHGVRGSNSNHPTTSQSQQQQQQQLSARMMSNGPSGQGGGRGSTTTSSSTSQQQQMIMQQLVAADRLLLNNNNNYDQDAANTATVATAASAKAMLMGKPRAPKTLKLASSAQSSNMAAMRSQRHAAACIEDEAVVVSAEGRLTIDEERLTIDEERKYAAPARNIPIVLEQQIEEDGGNSSSEEQNGCSNNEEDKNALLAIDSYRASERSNNNNTNAVIEASSFEDKPVCECQFCKNMISLEDLIQHEQTCEQQLSAQHIQSMLNQQSHLREFEDEFSDYIESTNPNLRISADSMARYRQRMQQLDAEHCGENEEESAEEDRRYHDSNLSSHPFSSLSQQNAAHHEGISNQSHGIPIVQMVQNREQEHRGPGNLRLQSESSIDRDHLEEEKNSQQAGADNLRMRLLQAFNNMESYPREHNRLSQSTPPENMASFQGASSSFGGSSGVIPGGNSEPSNIITSNNDQIIPQNVPLIFNRTTHPSGVVPRATNNIISVVGEPNQSASSSRGSFVAQPRLGGQNNLLVPGNSNQRQPPQSFVNVPSVSSNNNNNNLLRGSFELLGQRGHHQQPQQQLHLHPASNSNSLVGGGGQNEEDGDGGSAALTNEIMLSSSNQFPLPQSSQNQMVQQRNIFENRGGRRNYIQAASPSINEDSNISSGQQQHQQLQGQVESTQQFQIAQLRPQILNNNLTVNSSSSVGAFYHPGNRRIHLNSDDSNDDQGVFEEDRINDDNDSIQPRRQEGAVVEGGGGRLPPSSRGQQAAAASDIAVQQFLQNVVDNMSEEEAAERNLLIEGNGLEMRRHPESQLRRAVGNQRNHHPLGRNNFEIVVDNGGAAGEDDDGDDAGNNEIFSLSYNPSSAAQRHQQQQRLRRIEQQNSEESAYGSYGLPSSSNEHHHQLDEDAANSGVSRLRRLQRQQQMASGARVAGSEYEEAEEIEQMFLIGGRRRHRQQQSSRAHNLDEESKDMRQNSVEMLYRLQGGGSGANSSSNSGTMQQRRAAAGDNNSGGNVNLVLSRAGRSNRRRLVGVAQGGAAMIQHDDDDDADRNSEDSGDSFGNHHHGGQLQRSDRNGNIPLIQIGSINHDQSSAYDIGEYGDEHSSNDDGQNSEEYEQFLQLDEDVINPVPAQILELLPKSEFTEANAANFSEENKQCAICQECYVVKEKYIILPCLHRFHNDCVSQWFERKNTCPICKRRVTDEFGEDLNNQSSSNAEVDRHSSFQRQMNQHRLDQGHNMLGSSEEIEDNPSATVQFFGEWTVYDEFGRIPRMLQAHEEQEQNDYLNQAMRSIDSRLIDPSSLLSQSRQDDYDNDDSSGNLLHYRPSLERQQQLQQQSSAGSSSSHNQRHHQFRIINDRASQRAAVNSNNNIDDEEEEYQSIVPQYRGVRDILEEDQAQGLLHAQLMDQFVNSDQADDSQQLVGLHVSHSDERHEPAPENNMDQKQLFDAAFLAEDESDFLRNQRPITQAQLVQFQQQQQQQQQQQLQQSQPNQQIIEKSAFADDSNSDDENENENEDHQYGNSGGRIIGNPSIMNQASSRNVQNRPNRENHRINNHGGINGGAIYPQLDRSTRRQQQNNPNQPQLQQFSAAGAGGNMMLRMQQPQQQRPHQQAPSNIILFEPSELIQQSSANQSSGNESGSRPQQFEIQAAMEESKQKQSHSRNAASAKEWRRMERGSGADPS